MLNWMMPGKGNLQEFLSLKAGGANAILHDGAAVTPQLSATLRFQTEAGLNEYSFRLFHAALDTFVFAEERFRFSRSTVASKANWIDLGSGHKEAQIVAAADRDDKVAVTARTIRTLLRRCVTYQFHNTSDTARMRQRWPIEDSRFLKEDAANLGPFLLRLKEDHPPYYARIADTIRQIMPFFADFELEPSGASVMLRWRERGTDIVFGPHQASDGSLRLFALVALLLQPERDLPSLIILDEPELGLHPFAINVLAGLLKSVSHQVQVIVATQSASLVDCFDPEDVVVVERSGRTSEFRRLDERQFSEWLEEYSLAELWEKNVIGGRPSL